MSDFLKYFTEKSRRERVGEGFFNPRHTNQQNNTSEPLATPTTALSFTGTEGSGRVYRDTTLNVPETPKRVYLDEPIQFHGTQGTGASKGLMQSFATLATGEVQ